ncbi:MAG: hypothetical protein P1V81_06000 [Planctomycetota bacterium]|nr:hypothetical protein [Planctomycetota bacterium]
MARTIERPAGLVYWLPIAEATRRFDCGREAVTAAVRAGDLEVRAKVIGGEVVASVSSRDLTALFGEPLGAPTPAEPVAAPAPEPELERLHGQLVAAEDRARVLELDHARLEGRLETADRVERGLQRYADKLETRLDETREQYEARLLEAEHLRLNLARVVGRMETELARLQAKVEHYEQDAPRLLAAGEDAEGTASSSRPRRERAPKKKRRWFGRG